MATPSGAPKGGMRPNSGVPAKAGQDVPVVKVDIQFDGDGETFPEPGQLARMHYKLALTDGTVVESTRARGHPMELRIGIGQCVEGFEQGVASISVGTRALITVPPELGYGAAGHPPRIPPNAVLVFDVELIAVKDAPIRSLHILRAEAAEGD